MDNLIADFEAYNRAKNLAHETVSWYSHKLQDFAVWLDGDHPLNVTPHAIRNYLSDKMKRGFKPATVRGYYDALRAFYVFLVADEVIEEMANPMRKVSAPRVPQQIVEPLTEHQVQRLLETFNRKRMVENRDYVMCLLLLDSGLRVSELARIRLHDINFEAGRINVWGKGKKQRWAYIGTRVVEVLTDYMAAHRLHLANGSDVLFPSSRGGQMVPRSISRVVQSHLDAAGIPRAQSSAHRLRHTFATNLLRNGANVFCLQHLLGHSSLTMTRRYVRFDEQAVAEAHRMASPVDRMNR